MSYKKGGMKNVKTYKQKIILIIIIYIITIPVKSLGNNQIIDTNIVKEQGEAFGIQSFIQNSEKYAGEFFAEIDIGKILNSAISGNIDNSTIYKRILNLLGKEVKIGIRSILIILVIIIVNSILKAISEGLQNDSISKMIYYVQYIAIVTVVMSNFSDIVNLVKETTINLIGFINTLIPVLISLMIYTGSITTSSILEPIILFMINFIGNLIQDLFIPILLIITTISIISKVSDKVKIEKI